MNANILYRSKTKAFILVEVLISLLLISILVLAIFRFMSYFNQQYTSVTHNNARFLSASNFITRFKKDLDYAEKVLYNGSSQEILLIAGDDECRYNFGTGEVLYKKDEVRISYPVNTRNMETEKADDCPFIRFIAFDLILEEKNNLAFTYKKQYFKAMEYQCQKNR